MVCVWAGVCDFMLISHTQNDFFIFLCLHEELAQRIGWVAAIASLGLL